MSRYHNYASNHHSHEDGKYGEIEFLWKDGGTPGVKFNKIAHSGRSELLMFSIIAETQRVKQIRAALVPDKKGKSRVSASASGIKTNIPGREEWYACTPHRLNPSAEGYLCYQHKIGYGLAHAVFVTKSPGFIMIVTEETLWRELNTTRFTTPILRQWMPYIEKALRDCNRLEDAHVFNCHCGYLSATTAKLDEIVVQGLIEGKIHIPNQQAEAAVA